MPGEGEIGRLFDEILNLVEPIERPAMGDQHCGERRYTEVSAGPRAQQDSVAKRRGLGRLAKDGVELPNGPADEE
jgi:hypothetical protein